jgi:protein disulfide-isomerase A1
MASPRSLAVILLLLLATAAVPLATSNSKVEEEEDLQYLIYNAGEVPASEPDEWLQEEGSRDDEQEEDGDDLLHESDPQEQIDETHVVVLTASIFSTFLASHLHVMVEFYAPWWGHCQALAPDYAAAAAHLATHHSQDDLSLAKVDATEDTDLAQNYDVQGFPTILFVIDGIPKDYTGARTRDAIVTWIDKKLGPGVHNRSDMHHAERTLTGDDKAVLAFLDSLSVRTTSSSLLISPLPRMLRLSTKGESLTSSCSSL